MYRWQGAVQLLALGLQVSIVCIVCYDCVLCDVFLYHGTNMELIVMHSILCQVMKGFPKAAGATQWAWSDPSTTETSRHQTEHLLPSAVAVGEATARC